MNLSHPAGCDDEPGNCCGAHVVSAATRTPGRSLEQPGPSSSTPTSSWQGVNSGFDRPQARAGAQLGIRQRHAGSQDPGWALACLVRELNPRETARGDTDAPPRLWTTWTTAFKGLAARRTRTRGRSTDRVSPPGASPTVA